MEKLISWSLHIWTATNVLCRSVELNICLLELVYAGKGSNPEWNETFLFTVSDNTPELTIKLMDSDHLTQDDFVGEATWVNFLDMKLYIIFLFARVFSLETIIFPFGAINLVSP